MMPSVPFIVAPDVLNNLRDLCRKGFFVKRNFSMWWGTSSYHGKSMTYTPDDELSFDLGLKMIRVSVNKLFFFYACHLKERFFFIPESQVEGFLSGLEEIRKQMFLYRDNLLADYDNVIAQVRKRYEKVLYWKWINELKNTGAPPESYLESKSSLYISRNHNRDAIYQRFILSVRPVNVLLDERFSPFGDVQKMNESTNILLYNGILDKRNFLLVCLESKKKKFLKPNSNGPFVSLVNFVKLYKRTIFYEDPCLIQKIDDLREMVIKSPIRDKNKTVEAIDDIISYLTNDRRYVLQYVRKK